MVNVSLMQASPSIATAAAVQPGTPFAMLTNMAVRPETRRRGVAHQLMQVCCVCKSACCRWLSACSRRVRVLHASDVPLTPMPQAAVKTAVVDLDVAPPFALLLAYKYYEPAMRCVSVLRAC